jgi:alanyl-tRNA synthetase
VGTVVHVESMAAEGLDSAVAVVVDRTPFHPVDHTWPDQPSDSGTLEGGSVTSCSMGAFGPDGPLVGNEIPVKRGEPGWTWCVVHHTQSQARLGDRVRLEVSQLRRLRLSAAHTGCHVAALAMNQAAASFWRKEVRADGLGSPDLDQLAMESSVMDEVGSVDEYRFGKSLRERGFDAEGFLDALDDVVTQVRDTIAGWVAADGRVWVDDGGDRRLTAPRRWTGEFPEGKATMPCGGTHLSLLADLGAVTVDHEPWPDGSGLTVKVRPVACL